MANDTWIVTAYFNPSRHIRRAANGLWEWAEAPAELRAWASELFVSRNEDGDRAPYGEGAQAADVHR